MEEHVLVISSKALNLIMKAPILLSVLQLSCVLAQETHYCGSTGRPEVFFACENLGSRCLEFRMWA